MKTATYYEILGVPQDSDQESIKRAYRVLARKHHPDVSKSPRAHEFMAKINEAVTTLLDQDRRSDYDAMLAGGTSPEQAPRAKAAPKPVVVKLAHRLRTHHTPVYSVAFTPDTDELVSVSFDNEIIWWDKEFKTRRRQRFEPGIISTLQTFAEDRVSAAGASETTVSCWQINGQNLNAWRNQQDWITCVAISPDGRSVATGGVFKDLIVFDANSGMPRFRVQAHEESILSVAWSSNGQLLATGSADATVKFWNAKTGELVETLKTIRSAVTALAFSKDGAYLAVAAVDYSIRIFRLSDGQLVKMMFGHTKPIETLAFHPNNWLFASGSRDGTVGLWNAAKGIGNVRIEVGALPISTVAFSNDGTKFAASGLDKTVRIWNVAAKTPDDE